MRFYFDPKQTDILKQLSIKMGHAKFHYGFEYLGVPNRLLQTQLTDRCYLAMTLALDSRLGGAWWFPIWTCWNG
jgi:dynein heavy chain 1